MNTEHGEPPQFVKWLMWLFRKETWKNQPIMATVATIIVAAGAVTAIYKLIPDRNSTIVVTGTTSPKVILMDSTLPEVVYDPETRSKGGTNADDISEIIDDLPIESPIKETTSLAWNRDEQVLKMDPDLVIIHLSAFYARTNPHDSDHRLEKFLQFMAVGRAHFLLYTRTRSLKDQAANEDWLYRFERRIPALKGRLHLMFVPGGPKATFRNPDIARMLKLAVKKILKI